MKKLFFVLLLFIGCANADEPQLDHTLGAGHLAFSPDAKRLAVAGSDGVKIYESATGRVLETRKGSSFSTVSLAWSPDGKTLAAGGLSSTDKMHGEIIMWRDNQPAKRWFCDETSVAALRFSRDGQQLWSATASSVALEAEVIGSIRIWDVNTGKLRKTLAYYLTGEIDLVPSADGKWIVSQLSDEGDTHYLKFEAQTGKLVRDETNTPQSIYARGQLPRYAQKDRLVEIVRTYGADYGIYKYVVRDPKGKHIALQELGNIAGNVEIKFPYVAASVTQRYFPGYESQVKIWRIDPQSWKLREVAILNRTIAPSYLTSIRDGRKFFVQTNKGVLELDALSLTQNKLWPQSKQQTIQFPSAVVAVSDDGQRIFNNRWVEMTGQSPSEVVQSEKLIGASSRTGAMSPDGKHLLAPYKEGIAIYDEDGSAHQLSIPRLADDAEEEAASDMPKPLLRATFSPTEPLVAVVIGDWMEQTPYDGLYLYDFDGKLKFQFKERLDSKEERPVAARDAVFSPDGSQLFCAEFGRDYQENKKWLRLYRLNAKSGASEKSVVLPLNGLHAGIRSACDFAISPDGKTLALSGNLTENGVFGPRILIFDTETLQKKTSLPVDGGIFGLIPKTFAFDFDNNLAILRGQSIDVWNPKTHSIVKSKLLQ